MAVSARQHIFLNGLLYVKNSKFHRSSFNNNTNVQYRAYDENLNCKYIWENILLLILGSFGIFSDLNFFSISSIDKRFFRANHGFM